MAEAQKVSAEDVIGEMCTCGHIKASHAGLNGHGYCESLCDCEQYTWDFFLVKKPRYCPVCRQPMRFLELCYVEGITGEAKTCWACDCNEAFVYMVEPVTSLQ